MDGQTTRMLVEQVGAADEFEGFDETADVLSDPDTMRAIEWGCREVERGQTVTLEQLRK